MKKNIFTTVLLSILFFGCTERLFAQIDAPVSVIWSQCYGGLGDDDIFTAQATPDSGVVMGGLSASSDGDLNSNNGGYDWWILKINHNRDTVFSSSYGGLDYDKCRYAIGNREDGTTMAFGSLHSLESGDVDTSQIIGQAESSWWLLKLNETGGLIYQKLYNGNGLHGGRSMLQTDDGGYMLCGWSTSTNNVFTGNHGSYDTYLMKTDSEGNTEWIHNYGGSLSDRCRSVVKTLDGGYAFNGGSFSNTDDFLNMNKGSRDIMVGKVDSLGNKLWTKLYGGVGREHGFGMSVDWDGNFLVCGEDSAASGDCNNLNGDYDGWILKINQENGDTIWTLNLGGSAPETAIRFLSLPDKGYIALLSTNSIDSLLTGQALGRGDIWLVRLDSLRNVIWNKPFGGSWGETANDIQIFDNGYMVWGLTASSSGDGDVLGHHQVGNNDRNKDVWAFFVVDSTLFSIQDTGVIGTNNYIPESFSFTISPSPNNGNFNVKINPYSKEDLVLDITNSLGEIVETSKITHGGSSTIKNIDISNHKKGIYNVTLKNKWQQRTKRVMVE